MKFVFVSQNTSLSLSSSRTLPGVTFSTGRVWGRRRTDRSNAFRRASACPIGSSTFSACATKCMAASSNSRSVAPAFKKHEKQRTPFDVCSLPWMRICRVRRSERTWRPGGYSQGLYGKPYIVVYFRILHAYTIIYSIYIQGFSCVIFKKSRKPVFARPCPRFLNTCDQSSREAHGFKNPDSR